MDTMISQASSEASEDIPWPSGSPLVPAGSLPDRDLRHTFEHLAEELLDLRVGREGLHGLGVLPLVDAQELPAILGVEVHPVGDVTRLKGHLLGGRGDLVVDLPDD